MADFSSLGVHSGHALALFQDLLFSYNPVEDMDVQKSNSRVLPSPKSLEDPRVQEGRSSDDEDDSGELSGSGY